MDAERPSLTQPPFLPMSRAEMERIGWKELDILLVSGDAYVDHPSFGVALLGRWLVAHGLRTGIVAQPPWTDKERARQALTAMGRPRLLAGVTAGAIDSMLAHYTAFRKKRADDAYTPGGQAGSRPNRAVLVYCSLVRQAFPGLPLIIGGIEASLRRASHYDFWSDSLRRSILLDSKADLLLYGMGERAILDAARLAARLAETEESHTPAVSPDADQAAASRPAPHPHRKSGEPCRRFAAEALGIPATVSAVPRQRAEELAAAGAHGLPSHEDIAARPELLVRASMDLELLAHQGKQAAVQISGERALYLSPPARPLDTAMMDALYALPFSRLPHPGYAQPIPAWEMIRTSITSHRGCAGGCAFCSLAQHQGRRIASRSRASVLAEARAIAAGPKHSSGAKIPAWAGSISDVGGPSANMWQASCEGPANCSRPSCLWPRPCRFFAARQKDSVSLLRDVAKTPGIRHVRVASGVRFDLALQDPEALHAYTMDFTGGQLKVAPEHCAPTVLDLMRKPSQECFERFLAAFAELSRKAGKEQYVIPYLMSAYPGCTDQDMRLLADWLRSRNWSPRQVQCFIPTPGTLATAMYYSGRDSEGNALYVARSDAERLRQHGILMGQSPRQARGHARPGSGRNRQERDDRKRGTGAATGGNRPGNRPASTQKQTGRSDRQERALQPGGPHKAADGAGRGRVSSRRTRRKS